MASRRPAGLITANRRIKPAQAAMYAGLAAVVAVVVVVAIFAAGTPIAFEAEAGTLASGATTAAPTGASGSAAVKFGAAASPTPTPTGAVNGMLTSDPNFFPLTVWLQTPAANAANYKAVGINQFTELYNNATTADMNALMANGQIINLSEQSTFTLNPAYNNVIKAWNQVDEPDNAQANNSGGYDPCITPATLMNVYNNFKAGDSLKRPVYAGFGRGVADTGWVGRGTCTGNTQYYVDASKAADIVAFDVYPVNEGLPLYYVAKGVDNLRGWAPGKPVWADIETTAFDSGNAKPTPAQTKYEVWSAIIHGATGIDYFCHIFSPTFHEAGFLTDPAMTSAITAINAQITSLAAVINVGTTVANTVTSSAGASVPVDTMTKSYGGSTYILAAAMRGAATTATYRPAGITSGTVTVLGENRTLTISGGSFTDSFAGYDVHLYKIN